MIDEQINMRPCRPIPELPPWSFPAAYFGDSKSGGGGVSIFGPPPLPVTMTTAVEDGEDGEAGGGGLRSGDRCCLALRIGRETVGQDGS